LRIQFLASRAINKSLIEEFEQLEQQATATAGRIFNATHSGKLDDRGYEALYQRELISLNSICQQVSLVLDSMLAQASPDDLSALQQGVKVDRSLISIVAHAYEDMQNPKGEGEW
jgi:hypothetical protein